MTNQIRCFLTFSFLFVLITLACSLPASAQIWQVDFQGNDNHNGLFGQAGPIDNGGPGAWNIFEVQSINFRADSGTNSDVTLGSQSLPLLDSAGVAGSVVLEVESAGGFLTGWAGTGGGADPLRNDYLLALTPGGDTFFGYPGASSPLNFGITGLDANAEYFLTFTHGDISTNRGLDFLANGVATSVSAAIAGVPAESTIAVMSDGSGAITGTGSFVGDEGNWAGLTISTFGTPPIFADVNTTTGEVVLKTVTAFAGNVIGYDLTSATTVGGLDPSGWTSITDNFDGDSGPTDGVQVDTNDNWTELPGSNTSLAEAELNDPSGDGAQLPGGLEMSLGNVWIPNPYGNDLQLELLLDDGTREQIDVRYDGVLVDNPLVLADHNGNGQVDIGDWPTQRDNGFADLSGLTPAGSHAFGDLNGDGVNNLTDALIFSDLFVAAQGLDALSQLTGYPVPEPSSFVLILAGALAFVLVPKNRHRGFHQQVSPMSVVLVRRVVSSALALVLFVGLLSQASAQLWQVDFQGNDLHNGLFGQTDPVDTTAPGAWNIFQVQSINENTSTNGAGGADNDPGTISDVTLGAVSMPLVDATGGASPVVLEVESAGGFLSGWSGTEAESAASSLRGDWLLALSTGGDSFFGYPGASNPLNYSITGLAPNVEYSLTFTHGPVGGRGLDFTANGVVVPNIGAGNFEETVQVTTDGTGAIAGSGAFTGNEGNWAGLTIASNLNPVTLEIVRSTGSARLLNPSGLPIELKGYEVLSTTGALDPTWSGLRGSGQVPAANGNNGDGWESYGPANLSATEVGEFYLTGSTTFDFNGTPLNLGSLYTGSNQADEDGVAFTFGTAGATEMTEGLVVFVDGVTGDFDMDNDVDGADFLAWQRGESPNPLSPDDLADWQANYGAGPLSAVTSVPEPGTAGLLAMLSVTMAGLRMRRRVRGTQLLGIGAALLLAVVTVSSANAARTLERDYRLGDDALEGGNNGDPAGSANTGGASNGFTLDSEGPMFAFQDITVNGAPTYADTSNRPGAGGSEQGVQFNGTSDYLATNVSMNAPTQMWDNPTFFPSSDFPLNYEGIFSHGMQLWAQPDQTALTAGVRQDLLIDTPEHGIFVADTGNWGFMFDNNSTDTGVAVSDTLDGNGWAHVMHIAGFGDPTNGGTAQGGAMYVNGIAVAADNGFYDPDSTPLSIGANQDGSANFYNGVLDDVELFLWGDNSDEDNGGSGPNGQNWGEFDLNEDNEWIAFQLSAMGVTDQADVDLDGDVDAGDITAFLPNWESQNIVNGIQIGDWNTRQNSDLNYDGIVDLSDVFILHNALQAGGLQAGFPFELLGSATVPEPSTFGLIAAFGVMAGAIKSRKVRRN